MPRDGRLVEIMARCECEAIDKVAKMGEKIVHVHLPCDIKCQAMRDDKAPCRVYRVE